MSTATKTPMTSILASAIAASGKSPWKNDAGCKSVGYNDLADERADHARFLQYLRTNRAGVEVRGVLIDSNLIGRVYLHCGTGFLALFSYLLANLNIHQEDLLTGSQEAIRHVSNILFNQ